MAITVTGGSGYYTVQIYWSSSYADHSEWSFSGSFDSSGVMQYSGARKTDVHFTDESNHTDTLIYSDGTGRLSWANGVLVWADYKEDIANGMLFSRVLN